MSLGWHVCSRPRRPLIVISNSKILPYSFLIPDWLLPSLQLESVDLGCLQLHYQKHCLPPQNETSQSAKKEGRREGKVLSKAKETWWEGMF